MLSIWDESYPIYIQHEVLDDNKFKHLNYKLRNKQLNGMLGRGGLRQNTTVLYLTLLCWRRHVSATVGHLQITKMYNEENYTEYDH